MNRAVCSKSAGVHRGLVCAGTAFLKERVRRNLSARKLGCDSLTWSNYSLGGQV